MAIIHFPVNKKRLFQNQTSFKAISDNFGKVQVQQFFTLNKTV